MAKVADSYFKVDPWRIVEEGFQPEYGLTAESVFSLGNEYMGVRGYFEEGFGGERLLGSYFNGVYERQKAASQGYKGIVQETEFMVNSLDWLYVRVSAGEESLDLASSRFTDFERVLDLRNGLLTRSFVWKTDAGDIEVKMERLISMVHNEEAAQRLTFTSRNYQGELRVLAGLDFNTTHGGDKMQLWNCTEQKAEENRCSIKGCTKVTNMEVESFCRLDGSLVEKGTAKPITEEKLAAMEYTCTLEAGESLTLEKNVMNLTLLARKENVVKDPQGRLAQMSFDGLLADNSAWWQETWEKSDIEISGDEENQQGIRFCIFQMFQTYHGAVQGTNIGAKGLTGEAYNGNAFWDTETYCLPFFLFHDKQAAKNLLYFRYATLDEARKRAEDLDCKGAFYPIATISGRECCSLWQHASLQLQASTAVAYGIWLYEKVTKDTSFTEEYGLEILMEVCRMLATRGDYNADHTRYGYYCVMGPDEFQMMVNQNCYTNYMGQFTFRYTLEVMKRMKAEQPESFDRVVAKVGYSEAEGKDWQEKADAMYIPFDEKRQLYEQHEGYFELPHVDVDAIPTTDFPLYHHWSYDRIYRNDMIKQPDVLMFLLLFNSAFSEDVIRKNYDFYEPRCIHESSLSPSVHSILAAQLHKPEEAFDFFKFATRMDLDNYNRNSGEGLHTTSIAAAWMNIVYGFGGLRSDADILSLAPSIPAQWEGYKFRIVYGTEVICVEVAKDKVLLKTMGGSDVKLRIYKEEVTINGQERTFAIPA